jgi:hypothetical protein
MKSVKTLVVALVVALVFAVFGVCGKAQSFPVQGHEIGETIDSYLQRVPFVHALNRKGRDISGNEMLDFCRSIPKRKLRGFIAQSQKDMCLELIAAVDDGRPFMAGTQEARSIKVNPQDPSDVLFRLPSSFVTVVGGKVVQIDAELHHTYAEVLLDVTSRLGPPTEAAEVVSQNTYGAVFHNPGTVWIGSTIAAVLTDSTEAEGGLHQVVRIKVLLARHYLDSLQTKRVDTLK